MNRTALHCLYGWSSDCKHGHSAVKLHHPLTMCHDTISLAGRVKPFDIHWRILAKYVTVNCTSQREVFEWVETFKPKRTSVLDKAESGRLSKLCTHNYIENANTLIREDWWLTVYEVGKMLDSRQNDTCSSQQQKRTAVKNCVLAPQQSLLPHCVCSNSENSKPLQTILTQSSLPHTETVDWHPSRNQSTSIL